METGIFNEMLPMNCRLCSKFGYGGTLGEAKLVPLDGPFRRNYVDRGALIVEDYYYCKECHNEFCERIVKPLGNLEWNK